MTAAAKPCPICGKPAAGQAAPFCSKRCADIDLHRWLKGSYAIPVVETDEEEGEEGDGGGEPPAGPDRPPSGRLH